MTSLEESSSDKGERTQSARWLSQSKHDLRAARINSDSGLYAWACFMSHQAAEKAVSAYLYARGAELIWGHGIADLCEDAMAFEPSFDLVKSSAIQLDKYFFGSRYPTTMPSGTPFESYELEDALRAMAIAEETISFVDRQIELLE